MAKLKRYDLYEGDDDLISLPGKQPYGRDEGLKAWDEYDRRTRRKSGNAGILRPTRRMTASARLPLFLMILTVSNLPRRCAAAGRNTGAGIRTAEPGRLWRLSAFCCWS
jgi:hypothetical protein